MNIPLAIVVVDFKSVQSKVNNIKSKHFTRKKKK